MTTINDATKQQIIAARPDVSTWLSANAGSGKTRVLTDRVARLLLNGVLPQNILCLTYTKAAAGEMQNRLFRRLGEWTMLSDDKLKQKLHDLGVAEQLSQERLENARTLFARAIETPGGLKIQTIHSFCANILRQFPLEAGLNPKFTEIDERRQKLIIKEILEELADGNGPSPIDDLAVHLGQDALQKLTQSVMSQASLFEQQLNKADIYRTHDLPPDVNDKAILEKVFAPHDAQMLKELIPHLQGGTSTDMKNSEKLAKINLVAPNMNDLEGLEGVFLTGKSAKEPFTAKITGTCFPTKDIRKAFVKTPQLDALMTRVQDVRDERMALMSAQRSWALYQFAHSLMQKYHRYKFTHGLLDFNDLIQKTKALLSDKTAAAWVLYRLDGKIDHILVDESQDTSPDQWRIIEYLTDEFTAGDGSQGDKKRTIFVVGDKKQSIYSFQGADPAMFDEMRVRFGEKAIAAGQAFNQTTLEYSFRSAPEVLTVVDAVFASENTQMDAASKHQAFKKNLPGRVDLWPLFLPPEKEEPESWTNPVDAKSANHHVKELAVALADYIAQMVENEILIEVEHDKNSGKPFARPVRYGDFLVLVQGRKSGIFDEMHRAFRQKGLPTAGADRLQVMSELAVKDLRSLLLFVATPDDSLSLAEVLRSPLFGLSEQDLFSLAYGRGKISLWQSLKNNKDTYKETFNALTKLLDLVDFVRPYELLEYILIQMQGRKNLTARLGTEVEEVIDAILTLALQYEQTDTPSLTGFLTWLDADDVALKREMESAGDQIRIMTVHGAKGLEAPIVILPDTMKQDPRLPAIMQKDKIPFWHGKSENIPKVLSQTVEAQKDSIKQERNRLLYVALTRAKNWIIALGAGEESKKKGRWYEAIENALGHLEAPAFDTPNGLGRRYQRQSWSKTALLAPQAAQDAQDITPDLLGLPAAKSAKDRAKTVIRPSDMDGAKTVDGAQPHEDALAYGNSVHHLLEVLPFSPKHDWPQIAAAFCDAKHCEKALAEARGVLENPNFSQIFAPSSYAEVSLAGLVTKLDNHPISGVIDRLIIEKDCVTAIDFKTNEAVPKDAAQIPLGLLRQMAAYGAALQDIYPKRVIKTAILWTKTQELMYIPNDPNTVLSKMKS